MSCETNGNDILVNSVFWKAFNPFFTGFLFYFTLLQELFPVNKRDQETFVAHFKKVGLGPIADFQVIYEECLQVVIVAIKFMSLIFFFFTYATSWCIKHCFWFLFGQETQRNYQVKVELKKHVTEMMKDEEPPKEVDKLYQYIVFWSKMWNSISNVLKTNFWEFCIRWHLHLSKSLKKRFMCMYMISSTFLLICWSCTFT